MDKIKEIKEHVGSLIKERGLSYNSLSLKYGKSGTYLHKFVTADAPKRLDEEFRKSLAKELCVPEQELTDIDLSSPAFEPPFITAAGALYDKATGAIKKVFAADSVNIDIIDVSACCGSGIENFEEKVIGQWNMPSMEYRTISTTSNPDNVKMIRARGDSMAPTLKNGDWVLADMSFRSTDSDGLYLIRLSTGLAIKRLQGSIPGHICVISDNPKYPPQTWESGEIQILGKIIYTLNAEKVG